MAVTALDAATTLIIVDLQHAILELLDNRGN